MFRFRNPGKPQVSPYIVGPYVKEICPLDPWQSPRSGEDNVYEQLGNTLNLKKGPIKVILIDHVPGIGLKGEVVEIKRLNAFVNLIPAQKAVYASDKNLILYKDLIESQSSGGPSSALSAVTANRLMTNIFLIKMSGEKEWTLEAWHIRAHLRRQCLIVPLNAIELPTEPIQGPNLNNEAKDFFVTVTINNNPNERISVHCMLHHLGQELDEDWAVPDGSRRSCILSEQEALLKERLLQLKD